MLTTEDNIVSKISEDQKYYSFRTKNSRELCKYITEKYPDYGHLTVSHDCSLKFVEFYIRAPDSIQWMEFILNGIKNSVDSHGIGLSEIGLSITLNYLSDDPHRPTDIEDSVMMLSRAYLVKVGHIIEIDDEIPPDPSDYGLGEW